VVALDGLDLDIPAGQFAAQTRTIYDALERGEK
jgi:hypothetical protein